MARTAKPAEAKAKPPVEPDGPGLWYCTWQIFLDTRRRLDEVFGPLELRARDFWMLAMAGAGNLSQHEIASRYGLDPSTLVSVIDAMERRGLLLRQRSPKDRRVQWVRRTDAGDRLYAKALPLAQRAEEQHLAALSPTQQRHLLTAMRKLAAISNSPEMP